jgi:hypothetical protein
VAGVTHTVVSGLRKDQSCKVRRLIAGGSTEENRKAHNQERPAELGRPTTITEPVGKLCCYDHTLVGCQSSEFEGRSFVRRTTAAEP